MLEVRFMKMEIFLLLDLGWHLTMTGVTVYSRKFHKEIQNLNLSLFTNFPQMAIIFECFALTKCTLVWENEVLVYGNTNKESYWKRDVFKVF